MVSTNLQSLFRSFLTKQSSQCLRNPRLNNISGRYISSQCFEHLGRLPRTQTRGLPVLAESPYWRKAHLSHSFSTSIRISQSTPSSSPLSLNPEIPPASAASTNNTSPYARALPPHAQCVLLRAPTAEDIEEAELDVEALPPEEVKLQLTDRAAEVCSSSYLPTHITSAHRLSYTSLNTRLSSGVSTFVMATISLFLKTRTIYDPMYCAELFSFDNDKPAIAPDSPEGERSWRCVAD